jgi:ubiquinone/menaquinone biosynthesis C-methylase UbiE
MVKGLLVSGFFRGLVHTVVAQPKVYDFVQYVLGREITHRRLRPLFEEFAGHSVLDIGGGTGISASLVPSTAHYICSDIDPQKLDGYRAKYPGKPGIAASATALPLRDKSVDYAVCIAIAHHLTDAQFEAFIDETARVVRKKFIFQDPTKRPFAPASDLLWAYDRGSNPRSADTLVAALERRFVVEQEIRYTIHHQYVLCVCAPKPAS